MPEVSTTRLLRPTVVEEFAAAVRTAAADNIQVQLTGSASLPRVQFDPQRSVQPISTLRCNKVIEHAVSDMTVIAQAGISLEALQQQLAWHNQWLPVDPPALAGRSPVQRTLGGLIATNSLGPLRYKCGDWRFLMLGMRWIDATGTLIKGGGRTVKNVAGYNTPRLMIGAAGTLGAIAEVTLRTFARPADEQCLVMFCSGPEQAQEIIAATMAAPLEPAYIQAIGGQGFADNLLQLPVSPLILVVGFLDRPHLCAGQIATLRALPQLAGVEALAQTAAQAGRLRLWMTSGPPGLLHFRLHALPSQVAGLITALQAAAKVAHARCQVVAEAGQGVLRGTLIRGDHAAAGVFWQSAQDLATQHAAELVLLAADPATGIAPHHGDARLYQRLKGAVDPANIFGNLATTIR